VSAKANWCKAAEAQRTSADLKENIAALYFYSQYRIFVELLTHINSPNGLMARMQADSIFCRVQKKSEKQHWLQD
jgi:hypothetical protein